uniref:dynein axonemal assembly factor 9-like n=1 Tax=Myxine glutinosa TaxID=7769 RepID=UPI00358EF95A
MFLSSLDSNGLPTYKDVLLPKMEFYIMAVRDGKRNIPVDEEMHHFSVKNARMTVWDVPDLDDGMGILGSVMFSESFLDSRIMARDSDGTHFVNSRHVVLTMSIPRYAIWMIGETDISDLENSRKLVKIAGSDCLGNRLSAARRACACVVSSSVLSSINEGELSFFSAGLAFVHLRRVFVIPMSEFTALKVFDKNSSTAVVMLVIKYKKTFLPLIPWDLQNSSSCLAFGFWPKSLVHREFYSKVLPIWRQNGVQSTTDWGLMEKEDLSREEHRLYMRLETFYRSSVSTSQAEKQLLHFAAADPDFGSFMRHFGLSSAGPSHLRPTELPVLLHETCVKDLSPQVTPNDKIIITIITGLPGSFKLDLCSSLVSTNRDRDRWTVLQLTADKHGGPCTRVLQQYLSDMVQGQSWSRGSKPNAKPPRLILLTPGLTDIVSVVNAVFKHPDLPVASHCVIGAITVCVNPKVVYMEHRLTFPRFLEQCTPGFVSAVVFTGPHKAPHHLLRELILTVNPGASIIMSECGKVLRKEDVELILSGNKFEDPAMVRLRHTTCPTWADGSFVGGSLYPRIVEIRISFYLPLEKPLFIVNCKRLKSSLANAPFYGNIYNIWGRVKFSDSDTVVQVNYNTLEGSLKLVSVQPGSGLTGTFLPLDDNREPFFLVFTGCDLKDSSLKNWLRGAAKQKPQKKSLRTKGSLTEKELRTVHTKRHLEPLPEGHFYNGTGYVSLFGVKSQHHPLMDTFVDEYLAARNEEVCKHNAKVDQVENKNIFEQ